MGGGWGVGGEWVGGGGSGSVFFFSPEDTGYRFVAVVFLVGGRGAGEVSSRQFMEGNWGGSFV